MIRFTLLFNPVARVWNLRFLLLWTVGIIGFSMMAILQLQLQQAVVPALQITGFLLLFFHHILGRLDYSGGRSKGFVYELIPSPPIVFGFIATGLFSLILSAVFRIATITKTKESIVRQRFVFLGSCAPTHPPYTPLSMLLNRSIARPLVRGEARYIMFVRAMILSLISIGVPAFAIYSIIITPLATQIYTQDLTSSPFSSKYFPPFSDSLSPPGQATILLSRLDWNFIDDPASYNIQMHVATPEVVFECQSDSTAAGVLLSVECPCEWYQIVNVSISLLIPLDAAGVYITPVQGNVPWSEEYSEYYSRYMLAGLGGVPLLPGSGLFGVFLWTRRDVILTPVVWGPSVNAVFDLTTHSRLINPSLDITGLQSTGSPTDSRVATLSLTQLSPYYGRMLQDTLDYTALSGIATFGGFWTFLNGAFALFFGANVIYFMFGRRPLSALGLVHMFQRRRLVRQWHEDFPAIQTEGGLPGSESAGIVAFIRERRVDLGEDPRATEDQSDVEAQKEGDDTSSVPLSVAPTPRRAGNYLTSKYLAQSGYILDETPLLDVDLGTDEVSDGNTKCRDKLGRPLARQ
ncbi:hypothetical protein B0H19DRAFT_1077094 [Mycena capillaripes]|nr:hypothetical protein B0H19DRAFT_1077094 [Mycena capillaripes]